MTPGKKIAGFILVLSICSYVFSLMINTFCAGTHCYRGFESLFLGAFDFFNCTAALPWLANPILFFAWMYYSTNNKRSLLLSSISVIISLSFSFAKEININEAGTFASIHDIGLGYWLWVASPALLLGGNIIALFKRESHD